MNPPSASFQFLSAAVLATFIGLMGLSFFNIRPAVHAVLKNHTLRHLLFFISLVLIGWSIAVFPGFVSMDDAVALDGIKDGQVTILTSVVYGYLLSGFKMTGLLYGGPVLLALIFYFIMVVRVLAEASDIKLSPGTQIILPAVLFIIFVWPVNLALLSYHTRDILYAVLMTNLFLLLKDSISRQVTVREVLEITAYTILIGTIRQEGILIAGFVILFFAWQKNINRKIKISVFASVVAALAANAIWSKQQLFWEPLERHYHLVQHSNSLSAILNSTEVNLESSALNELRNYYDFQCIKELKEGSWFSNPKGRCFLSENANPATVSFYSALLRVFYENRDIYLSHQWDKFKKIFNQSQLIQDMDSDPPGPAEKISDPKWPVKTAIFDYVILNHRYKSEETGPTFLLLAAIFALVSVFMLSGTVRWLLIIFHIRILILLAFTPDPQSKYFFTLCTLLPVSVMLLFRKYFLNRNLIKPQ
ncbi:MAG: hypothetical protein K0R29_1253 [Pseudobdellovibrio sp.]|nr:hypothetical protein [Pseudobdellovibrio sp.]